MVGVALTPAAVCKECREGERGTVLVAACTPPTPMSLFFPSACRCCSPRPELPLLEMRS